MISNIHRYPNVEISVKNFGPIAEGTVDLRPLTIFVGPSNTGKTYFSTLVYALHGVFKGFSRLGPLSSMELTRFLKVMSLKYSELLSKPTLWEKEPADAAKKLCRIETSFKLSDLDAATLSLLMPAFLSHEALPSLKHELQAELGNCFELNPISALRRLTEGQRHEMTVSLKVHEENQERWHIEMMASESDVTLNKSVNEELVRDMVIFPEGWSISADSLLPPDSPFFQMSFEDAFNLGWIGGNRYYLPAARSGIMQSHRILASSIIERVTQLGQERFPEVPMLSGVIANFLQKVILHEEDRRMNPEMQHLAETLESDVLSGEISLKLSAGGYPDFRYRPHGTKEDMRMGQASSMVSELAPLVLLLRSGIKPGDTLIIEEPEAHLHPGAQTDIAITLARLVRAGVRVIVTTHSDWLLEQIGNLILEGELEKQAGETNALPVFLYKEQVGCWHFQKSGKIEEIAFDRMDGLEPQEYADIAESLYNRSAEIHNRLEALRLNPALLKMKAETTQGIDGNK